MRRTASIFALALLFAGCDLLGGGNGGDANVAIRMGVAGSSPGASLQAGRAALAAADEPLVITGTNGTLTITDVRFVVDKFKLKGDVGECRSEDAREEDDNEQDDDACEHFQARAVFVDLPFNGDEVTLVTDEVPAGVYRRLEFKVKNLDLDDDSDDDEGDEGDEDAGRDLEALAEQIRAEFPAWPEDASMVVVGTFMPTDGEPRAFTAFADAEIDVKFDLDPDFVVDEDGADRALTIQIRPDLWFQSSGAVLDLSAYDHEVTDDLLEFELKMRQGFTRIEFDDEDEDDDEGDDD